MIVRVFLYFFLLVTATLNVAASPTQLAKVNLNLNRFEHEIRTLEEKDTITPPPAGATIFVGSSTFARWSTLEQDLHDVRAVNRGFGGSTIDEVTNYSDRIVSKYKPARIVFYAGTNDIGELHHTAAQVAQDFAEFVAKVHSQSPVSEIYFVSLSVAPSRLADASEFRQGNQLIAAYCKKTPRLHFIDVTSVMRDHDGRLRKELFGPDHLHMNRQGYALWIPVIRQALR